MECFWKVSVKFKINDKNWINGAFLLIWIGLLLFITPLQIFSFIQNNNDNPYKLN